MNKKLLICGAIAIGLVLSACVKKETPAEEQNTPAETQTAQPSPEPKFEDLTPTEPASTAVADTANKKVEIIREDTENTTTEIRREIRAVEEPAPKPEAPKPTPKPEPKPEAPKPEPTPSQNNNTTSSQDDAVAAAIAAATPALD